MSISFSMHLFYRNRLVEMLSRRVQYESLAEPLYGFDRNDDLHLKDFSVLQDSSYDGPYPVINASLNLVKGKDLAWQERKAESFVMTPRYCGFDVWLEEQDTPILQGERTMTPAEFKLHAEERSAVRTAALAPQSRSFRLSATPISTPFRLLFTVPISVWRWEFPVRLPAPIMGL